MALYMVLEDFSGDLGGPPTSLGGPPSIVQAGTLLDSAAYNITRLLNDGCPLILYDPATMSAARTAFEKMSGGLAQINPDGNLLALLFATGVISGVVGPSTVVYVDPNGDDSTGQRGNAARPFQTIQAALAAMLNGDQMRLAPNATYAAPTTPFPAILVNGSIVGYDSASTVVSSVGTGNPVFDLSVGPGQTRQAWNIGGVDGPTFRLVSDSGIPNIRAHGDNAPIGTYFANGALSVSAVLGGGVDVSYAATVVFGDCVHIGIDLWTLFNCAAVFFIGFNVVLGGHDLDYTYDAANAKTPPISGGPFGLSFFGGTQWFSGFITLLNQASCFATPGNSLPTVQGDGLDIGPGPGFQSTKVQLDLSSIHALDLQSPGSELPDNAHVGHITLNSCKIVTDAKVKVAGAAAHRAVFDVSGSVATNGTVLADNGVDGIANGFGSGNNPLIGTLQTAGTGTMRVPAGCKIPPVPVTANPQVVPLGITLPDNQYSVALDADNALTLPLATTARSATDFTVTLTVIAGDIGGAIFPN